MATMESSENVVGTTPKPQPSERSVTVLEKQVQRRIFKIIVIGDSNVGKTCLTYRFCCGKFPDKTEATIGVDFRERVVDVDGEQLKVFCDTCSYRSDQDQQIHMLILFY